MSTPEQEARDMLGRMGWVDAQSLTSGEVVELANLIHAARGFTWADVDLLTKLSSWAGGDDGQTWYVASDLDDLAARIAALLPPR